MFLSNMINNHYVTESNINISTGFGYLIQQIKAYLLDKVMEIEPNKRLFKN